MVHFTTNSIKKDKNITIINVWSYKVRVAICSFFEDWQIELLWYWEKRQSVIDTMNGEAVNVSWICSTIKEALTKAEEIAGISTKKIIINSFFSDNFFYSKNINYRRLNKFEKISEQEIYDIVRSAEKIGLWSSCSEIERKFSLWKDEINLIVNSITKIKIDSEKTNTIFSKTWENISLELLNIFTSKNNFELINQIWIFLDKEILKIIPEEYSITKIWDKKLAIVFVDIWNSSTYLTIKWEWNSIIGSIKISVWINDLLKSIQLSSSKSRAEIIKKLNREDLFKKQKKDFLDVFWVLLSSGIKEIIWDNICPYNFILTGWWSYNEFIKEFLVKARFDEEEVKIVKDPEFILPDIEEIWKIKWVEEILHQSSLALVSQIIATWKILKSSWDVLEKALIMSACDFLE